MMCGMNKINHAINGLASSLLLNVGLTHAAEKLDPMVKQTMSSTVAAKSTMSCEPCIYPCYFTPETGR